MCADSFSSMNFCSANNETQNNIKSDKEKLKGIQDKLKNVRELSTQKEVQNHMKHRILQKKDWIKIDEQTCSAKNQRNLQSKHLEEESES